MNWIQNIETWGDRHHPKWLDILRILLGLVITWRGVVFVSNTAELQQMIAASRFEQVSFFLAHYVAFAHLVGGVLITVGLITRIAVIFQLPILIGAVFFVNLSSGIFTDHATEFWFSVMVLFLLVFFLVEGSGPWSIDEYMRKHPEKNDWEEELKKNA
jgi:uncharacterized membrane protein YphA (DoxX/SURF4 family)